MNIEKQISDSAALPDVDRDDVRSWVVAEQSRLNRTFALRCVLAVVVFFGSATFLIRAMDAEMQQVRQMVHKPRSGALVMLEEVANEVCGEPPAEFWVQQLTRNRSSGSIISL